METPIMEEKSKDNKYGQKGAYEDYEISSAAETLSRAEEIRGDSKLLGYAKKCLGEDLKAKKKVFKSLDELTEYASRKRDTEDSED